MPGPRFNAGVLGGGLLAAATIFQPASAEPQWKKTTVVYREVDGHKILADVHRPDNDKPCPVIVWLHGGALINGNRERIHPKVLALAEREGCAVVSLDYRLAPETKLPELMTDIEAAFQWIATDGARRFNLDPERIVSAGESGGGYLALATGHRVKPRPKAIVALYGYGSLTGDWYMQPSPHARHNPKQVSRGEALRQTDGTVISDSRDRKGNGGDIYLHYRQTGTWPLAVSGFTPETLAEKIAPYEPVRNVTADFPPTVLIHGTNDTDVPYAESDAFARQLEKHGVAHVFSSIENAEHGFGGGDPQKIEESYRAMNDFVAKQLADR